MSFEINCPSCSTRLAVEEAHIGQMVRCPNCQKATVVPDPRAPAAPVRAPERGYDDRERAPRSRRDDYDDEPPPIRRRRDPNEGSGSGIAAMVLGIVAIVLSCIPYVNIVGLICAILAIILGALGRSSPGGGGMAVAGLVMGIIVVALWLVGLVLVFALGVHVYRAFG